jgi:hypothetical protein
MREHRTEVLAVLNTPSWKAAIERAAAAHDTTVSEFARQALYGVLRQKGFAPTTAGDEAPQ